MELEALICPQCGGRINEATMQCEFCGTNFRSRAQDVLKIELERPGVHTLRSNVLMDDEMVAALGAEKASELALQEMAQRMARCIMPFVQVRTEQDYFFNKTRISGWLTVVDKGGVWKE